MLEADRPVAGVCSTSSHDVSSGQVSQPLQFFPFFLLYKMGTIIGPAHKDIFGEKMRWIGKALASSS